MKLIYKGKYNGDPETLPKKERENAVKFKEFSSMKNLSIVMNILGICLAILCFAVLLIRGGGLKSINLLGVALSLLSLFPHELLHAICFKETVELYTNLKQGMLFVTGTEDMSKARFVFMVLLPNIVFGFIPFIIFLIFPSMTLLGTLGSLTIGLGAGDYINAFNCISQVPKGGKVYLSGENTYWFLPEDKK